ncbi:TIGR04086 family membrane protein [Pelosinus sp. sgz500959]|uniref:TIGR04086 family membrane protein n=1 Tax=Pelosinus sp. sgz500959 TaxID=3242472 RepID=UPI00366DD74A
MSKRIDRTRLHTKPPKVSGTAMLIIKGVVVSFTFSLACVLFLTMISMMTENAYVDNYIQYIMVGVTMLSIFSGSVYAAHHAAAKGMLIGIAIGIIYVLFSVGIGMELNQGTVSVFVLANKFVAGIAVGILGSLVGVNL